MSRQKWEFYVEYILWQRQPRFLGLTEMDIPINPAGVQMDVPPRHYEGAGVSLATMLQVLICIVGVQ